MHTLVVQVITYGTSKANFWWVKYFRKWHLSVKMKIYTLYTLCYRSGIETRLQNAVFHLLRTKAPGPWVIHSHQTRQQEPLAYMLKIQVRTKEGAEEKNNAASTKQKKDLLSIFCLFFQSQWERRILKSLNSMCSELGLCLAKPRCKDEQNEYASKWNELSTLDIDLSLFRPVYAPKDFLEILTQVLCLHVTHICWA